MTKAEYRAEMEHAMDLFWYRELEKYAELILSANIDATAKDLALRRLYEVYRARRSLRSTGPGGRWWC